MVFEKINWERYQILCWGKTNTPVLRSSFLFLFFFWFSFLLLSFWFFLFFLFFCCLFLLCFSFSFLQESTHKTQKQLTVSWEENQSSVSFLIALKIKTGKKETLICKLLRRILCHLKALLANFARYQGQKDQGKNIEDQNVLVSNSKGNCYSTLSHDFGFFSNHTKWTDVYLQE